MEPMKSQYTFKFSFDGSDIEANTIDVQSLASSLNRFAMVCHDVGKCLYGEKADMRLRITADPFKGSWGAVLIADVSLHDYVVNLFQNGVTPACEVIGGAVGVIQLKRWLGKNKIVKTTPKDGGVEAESSDGRVINVNVNTVNIYNNPKASDSIDNFVNTSLIPPGIDSIKLETDKVTEVITKADVESFQTEANNSVVLGNVEETVWVSIDAPSFNGGKWRLSNQLGSFWADITDEAYMKSVDNQAEKFAKGDALRVTLVYTSEQLEDGKIHVKDYNVTKVHDHRSAPRQQSLI